jgi:transposase InsO family protein
VVEDSTKASSVLLVGPFAFQVNPHQPPILCEKRFFLFTLRREKQQIIHRVAAPLIRHLLARFRAGELSATAAAQELQLGKSRFYELYSEYLQACAQGMEAAWAPGSSGGDHQSEWPKGVADLLRKRLTSKPPSSYAFAAEEVHRLLNFRLDRATVRRFALAEGLAKEPAARLKAPVRRWQRSRIGELWQMDATPHRWFPHTEEKFPFLNLLDDCSRLHLNAKIYSAENLLAYLDLLPKAFSLRGLPLEIYVDYHSIFFSHIQSTQLGEALRFYGVSFRYAPTPQAKGKIERDHQTWQNRLPALFASEQVTSLTQANQLIEALLSHRNVHEKHRELNMTPQCAWDKAQEENRSALRPVPTCPWWPFVWSQRSGIQVGPDRRIRIGELSIRVEVSTGTWLILCTHPSGHHSVLQHHPKPNTKPVVLFTNLPK